jgi:hypothetical protein
MIQSAMIPKKSLQSILSFLIFSPLPIPFPALNLLCRLLALADALFGMANVDLLLLLHLLLPKSPWHCLML